MRRKRLTLATWNSLTDHEKDVELAVEHDLQRQLDTLLESTRNKDGALTELAFPILLAKMGF